MGETDRFCQVLLEISRLLAEDSAADPGSARAAALALLCPFMEAQGGVYVPAEQGSLVPKRASSWGAAIDLDSIGPLLHECLSSDQPVLRRREASASRELLLSSLGNSRQKLGALVFEGDRLRVDPDAAAALRSATASLSVWEQGRFLRGLLSLAQKKLRSLTADSQAVARRNQELAEKMVANQRRLDGVSKGFIRMQEEERSRISRELHDGVGQLLTALKINLDLVAAELTDKSWERARERLRETVELAAETIEDVRELSRLLRPRMLDELGLVPTLKWLARSFSERTELTVTVDSIGSARRLDPDLETLLFRVAQEGVNNAWKHARASIVDLSLAFEDRTVGLEIRDDGIGVAESAPGKTSPGSGLPGIRERVALAGGELEIHSRTGRGTALHVRIPLDSAGPSGENQNQ